MPAWLGDGIRSDRGEVPDPSLDIAMVAVEVQTCGLYACTSRGTSLDLNAVGKRVRGGGLMNASAEMDVVDVEVCLSVVVRRIIVSTRQEIS